MVMMKPKLLMVKPKAFNVQYIINPWMQGQIDQVNTALADQQWQQLYRTLSQFAEVSVIEGKGDLPDMVFVANAGVVKNNTFIAAHFRHTQRQPESPYYIRWFQSHGFSVKIVSDSVFFEGTGDALFQPSTDILWFGYGIRSDYEAIHDLSQGDYKNVNALKLIDHHFYHLDTCFCPLHDGYVMYYPQAFDQQSLATIANIVPKNKRIEVDENDANAFACNAVALTLHDQQDVIVLNGASDALKKQLEAIDYKVLQTPVSEFRKAGGATKCLVLELQLL